MTGTYDKLGVRFLYPEGWKITEDEPAQRPRSVALESPTGGTWQLLLYDAEQDARALTTEAAGTIRAEYDQAECTDWSLQLDDVEAIGQDMYFYHLDFLIHARALAASLNGQTLLFLWQAEDRDFDELEAVFRAITTTVLNPQKYASVLDE